jgi:hypothetical protein
METIITRVGRVDYGECAHFGKRLYHDLSGHTSFLALAVFAISGKLLSTDEAAVLDDVGVCIHCPEPRVWPAKLGRIAASAGRFSPGMVVGWAVLISHIGVTIAEEAARSLLDLRNAVGAADCREPLIVAFVNEREMLPGFGVHARRVDERVLALRACIVKRNRHERPFWKLAEELWATAEREQNLTIGVWGAVSAALLDLGMEPDHMPPLLSLLFQPSLLAHAVEGARLKSPSLRRLPPEAVRYVGAPHRRSPRVLASEALEPATILRPNSP